MSMSPVWRILREKPQLGGIAMALHKPRNAAR
jgi:hypothetical protein